MMYLFFPLGVISTLNDTSGISTLMGGLGCPGTLKSYRGQNTWQSQTRASFVWLCEGTRASKRYITERGSVVYRAQHRANPTVDLYEVVILAVYCRPELTCDFLT